MENNKVTFSIDNDLISSAIEKQINEYLSAGKTDKDSLILSIVQQILNARTTYGRGYSFSGNGETFFDGELRYKLTGIVSDTIKNVLEKNSSVLKTIIEKEITANLHNIADYLVDSVINKDKTPIRVVVNTGIHNFTK